MKGSLGISNFPEEISSLSHSIVFLYFFALITEEGFLISPGYSLELCIQMGISFLFSFAFHFLFTAICKASSDNHFAFLYFFSMGMVLIPVSQKLAIAKDCDFSVSSSKSWSNFRTRKHFRNHFIQQLHWNLKSSAPNHTTMKMIILLQFI